MKFLNLAILGVIAIAIAYGAPLEKAEPHTCYVTDPVFLRCIKPCIPAGGDGTTAPTQKCFSTCCIKSNEARKARLSHESSEETLNLICRMDSNVFKKCIIQCPFGSMTESGSDCFHDCCMKTQ